MNDDENIAALVVALISPFEDRIIACERANAEHTQRIANLELELQTLRGGVARACSMDDLRELKKEVASIETKQKAAAVMSSHMRHDVIQLKSHPPVASPAAVQAASPAAVQAAAPPQKKAARGKGIAFIKGGSPSKSAATARAEDASSFMFNFSEADVTEPEATKAPEAEASAKKPSSRPKAKQKKEEVQADTENETAAKQAEAAAKKQKDEAEAAAKKQKDEADAAAKKKKEEDKAAKKEKRARELKAEEQVKAAAEAEEEEMVAQAAQRLRAELVWCIAQLDAGVSKPDVCEEQVRESQKVKKLLLSNKVPLVRKRHTMNLVFGDYRTLMKSLPVPDDLLAVAELALDKAAALA